MAWMIIMMVIIDDKMGCWEVSIYVYIFIYIWGGGEKMAWMIIMMVMIDDKMG